MIILYSVLVLIQCLQAFSISLEPLQSTPHIKLCNINQDCEQILLVLDTGSPDLWVSDESCQNCPRRKIRCLPKSNQGSHNLNSTAITSDDNSTISPQNQINYGIGWVKGYELQYKLCGIMTRLLCVTQARDIKHYGSDGVIGIGGNSTGKQFLLQLIENLKTPKAISFYFGRYFTELTVGDFNYDLIRPGATATYFQTTPEWTLSINEIKVNQTVIVKNVLGLIDTGSSLLVFPEKLFIHIKTDIQTRLTANCSQQAYGISCLCESINAFPTIELSIASSVNNLTSFLLPPQAYVSRHKQYCVAQILRLKTFEDILILGNPFLKQYVTLFDLDKQMIAIVETDKDVIEGLEIHNLGIITIGIFSLICIISKAVLFIMNKKNQSFEGKLII